MNTEQERALLPCPFCGPGESVVSVYVDDVAQRYRVGCGRCGASTGIHPRDKTEAPAIEAWNRRAALQSQDRTAWINTLERKAEALWTAAGEDRHEAMKDLLHHARIGVQSQDRADAERYRWLREHGFNHADVELTSDLDGNPITIWRLRFYIPEPSGLLYEEDEWTLEQLDAAIDRARRGEGGGE